MSLFIFDNIMMCVDVANCDVEEYKETGERLTQFIEKSGLNQAKIAKLTRLNPATISRIAPGNQVLGDNVIDKLTYAFDVNAQWLRFGIGEMGTARKKVIMNAVEDFEENDTARFVAVYDSDVFKPVKIIRYKVWASFVDTFDEFNFEDVEDTVNVYLPDLSGVLTENHMVFEVLGDSMETTLMERAKVLAELLDDGDIEYLNGGVYIVAYRNKLVAKRIIDNDLLVSGTLTLHSDNPSRGKITIRRSDIRYIWKVTDIIGSKVR